MSYLAYGNTDTKHKPQRSTFNVQRIWLSLDGLNIFGISNVNSYYWVTDVTNRHFAVPNYLTGRQINAKVLVEF